MEMEMVAFMKDKVGMDKSGLTIQLSIPSYLDNYEEILVNLNRILSYDRLIVRLEAEVPTPEKDEDGNTVTVSSGDRSVTLSAKRFAQAQSHMF